MPFMGNALAALSQRNAATPPAPPSQLAPAAFTNMPANPAGPPAFASQKTAPPALYRPSPMEPTLGDKIAEVVGDPRLQGALADAVSVLSMLIGAAPGGPGVAGPPPGSGAATPPAITDRQPQQPQYQ